MSFEPWFETFQSQVKQLHCKKRNGRPRFRAPIRPLVRFEAQERSLSFEPRFEAFQGQVKQLLYKKRNRHPRFDKSTGYTSGVVRSSLMLVEVRTAFHSQVSRSQDPFLVKILTYVMFHLAYSRFICSYKGLDPFVFLFKGGN